MLTANRQASADRYRTDALARIIAATREAQSRRQSRRQSRCAG
jgi:hypothetical protein